MRMGALLGTMLLMVDGAGAQQARPPVSPTPVYVGPELTPTSLARIQEEAARVLFWDQAERDANFPHMEKRFPAQVVKAPARARPLPTGKPLSLPAAEIDAFIRETNIAGLLVLDYGRVRLERYARGLTPTGHWASFSVAKSFTSTLVGAAIRDGYIGSVSDPVTRYIPEMRGSAYDGVTIEQVLTMTSGVKWNEDYTDPDSDVVKFGSEPAKPGEDPTVSYLRRLPREATPGTKWVYKTGETNLIGVVVSRATKLPLANYAAARIAGPAGFERDGVWQVSATGQAIGGCCINLGLRDYGRMGQFVVDGGMGQVPADWFDKALTPHHRFGTSGRGYGYQWWTYPEGAAAEGIYGQGIFVDRAHRIVVVMLAAWHRATDPKLGQVSDDFTRRIVTSIVAERTPRPKRR